MHFRIILFSLALGQALVAHAADWPQWRGPTRDGVLPAKGLAMTTLPNQPSVLWKIKSREGLASPVVANGSVFHFENRNGNETMVALSIADGSEHCSSGGFSQNRNWRFGRNSRDRAIDKMVQHYVTNAKQILLFR